MVLWRPRKTISVMEPEETAEFSPPASEEGDLASEQISYTVPPASPTGSADAITAVQRANTPERRSPDQDDRKPREWKIKRPQNVQLSLKSKCVQNNFPAKPNSRTRFVKTKRTTTATCNSAQYGLTVSGNASPTLAKITPRPACEVEFEKKTETVSKSRRDSSNRTPRAQQQRDWTWDGESMPYKSATLQNADTKTRDHIREKYRRSPVRTRRGSIALPVNRSTTHENYLNLAAGTRPKSGSPAYRRVHYQVPGETNSSQGRKMCREGGAAAIPGLLSTKSPSASRSSSPQPNFASQYIAEIFQTSDKFLISRPGSGRTLRPASARPPPRPKSAQPSMQSSTNYRTHRMRPASAFPSSNAATTCKTTIIEPQFREHSAVDSNNTAVVPASASRIENLGDPEIGTGTSGDKQFREDSVETLANSKDELRGTEISSSPLGNVVEECSSHIDPVSQRQTTFSLQDQTSFTQREYDSRQTDDYNQGLSVEGATIVDSSFSYNKLDLGNETESLFESGQPLSDQDACLTFSSQNESLEPQRKENSSPREGSAFNLQHKWTNSSESLLNSDEEESEFDYGKTQRDPESKPSTCISLDVQGTWETEGEVPNQDRSERTRPRTAATRKDMEAHFQREKQAVLDDLRSDLGRRLRMRRKSGIMSDAVFQKQIRSSFWTSDMLYHRWGNGLLELRKKWKSCTGRLEDQSDPSEDGETGPVFPRGRRFAFSNERSDGDSPLDFEALRSIATVNATLHRVQTTDTPSGSPTASQVSFKGHPPLRRAVTTGSLTQRSNPPVTRQSSKVELRPQALLNLADVNVGLRLTSTQMNEDPDARRLRLRALFIATVTKVMRITRVAICMIRSSKDLNVANFMAQIHFYNTRTMEEDLTFEKEKFSRKYSKLHVPNWAREIGLKPPWDRTPDDVMALYSIMKNLKSFEKFTHQMRLEICRAATYSCCEKGRVILRQGHVGHNFYFIFSGSVFVQIDIEDSQTGVMTPSKTSVMEKGSSFGELALLGGGTGRRRASIICRETTELFEIEKETFLELCPDIFEKELKEKIDTAKKYEIFRQFPDEVLERLCFESFIEEVAYGRVIERDTAHTDTIFFILNGKVIMLKEFNLSSVHPENRIAIQAYGDMVLPTPRPRQDVNNRGRQTLPQATDKNSCFMRIGELREGDCTEIALLHISEKHRSPGVILVSNGVRLMRVSKRKLEQFAPKDVLEKLRRQIVHPLRVPTDEDLYKKYLGDVNWAGFKSKVVDTLQEERTGAPIVNKPSTAKGSSGWARWPGSGVKGAPSCAVRAKSAPPRVRRRGMSSN